MTEVDPRNTAAPLAVPSGDHYLAGWVSPEQAEAAERIATGLEIDREQETAERAVRENLISERIAERRAGQEAPAGTKPDRVSK